MYNSFTNTLLHWTLIFHVLVSQLHRCTEVYDMTVYCIINIDIAFMLHGFTRMHALIIHVSLLHGLLLLEYSYITVT